MTRNPKYAAVLAILQLVLGIYLLDAGKTLLGGFTMWCCGVNTVLMINTQPKTT
jgi:hypothetical protein